MVDVWLSAASECSPPAMTAHFALHSEHGHGNRESMCIGKVLALSRACVILSLLDCQAFPPHSPNLDRGRGGYFSFYGWKGEE